MARYFHRPSDYFSPISTAATDCEKYFEYPLRVRHDLMEQKKLLARKRRRELAAACITPFVPNTQRNKFEEGDLVKALEGLGRVLSTYAHSGTSLAAVMVYDEELDRTVNFLYTPGDLDFICGPAEAHIYLGTRMYRLLGFGGD